MLGDYNCYQLCNSGYGHVPYGVKSWKRGQGSNALTVDEQIGADSACHAELRKAASAKIPPSEYLLGG